MIPGGPAKRKPAPKAKAKKPAPVVSYTPPKSQKPRRVAIKQAKAQQAYHVSQGRQVEKAANQQKKLVPAKAQEREHVSQGKAVEKAANSQAKSQHKAAVRKQRQATAQKFFGPKKSTPVGDVAKVIHTAEDAVVSRKGPETVAKGIGKAAEFTKKGVTGYQKAAERANRETRATHGGKFVIATARGSSGLGPAASKGGKFATKLGKDALDIPATSIPNAYHIGDVAIAASRGNTKPAKKVIKAFKENDPVYNAVAAGVEKIEGKKSASLHLKRAKKSFSDHPGAAILEAAGVASGAGVVAGAGVRGLGRSVEAAGKVTRSKGVEDLGKRVHKVGGTEHRQDATVPGTSLRQRRRYHRNLAIKAAQVVKDKHGENVAHDLRHRAQAAEAAGKPQEARDLHAEANRKDPKRMSPDELGRRMDERLAVNEDVRRHHRTEAVHAADKATGGRRKRDKHGDALTLRAQNIIRSSKDDILKYVEELRHEHDHGDLDREGKRQNLRLRKALEKYAGKATPHDLEELTQLASEYSKSQRVPQARLGERGMVDFEQGAKAREIPYAVRRGVGEVDLKLRPTLKGAMIREAKDARRAAEGKLTVAKRKEAVTRVRVSEAKGRVPSAKERNAAKAREAELSSKLAEVNARLEKTIPGTPAHERLTKRADNLLNDLGVARRAQIRHGDRDQAAASAKADRRHAEAERKTARAAVRASKLLARDARSIPGPKKERPGLVDPTGRKLDSADVKAARVAAGDDQLDPAFVSHARNQSKSSNFNVRSERPADAGPRGRTGASVKSGDMDTHPDRLIEQAARTQGLIDAHDGFTDTVGEFGAKNDAGELRTFGDRKKAEKFLRNRPLDAEPMRVVRINPFLGPKTQLEHLIEHVNADSEAAHINVMEAMKDALTPAEGTKGPFAVIPEHAAAQLEQHINSMGHAGDTSRAIQKVSQMFRGSVLATSPTYMIGNATEAGFRSAVAGAGPRAFFTGRRVVKAMKNDPHFAENDGRAFEEAMSRMVGGGHYGMQIRARVRRDASQFSDRTRIGRVAQKLGRAMEKPGLRHGAEFWNRYTQMVFEVVNRRLETNFQTAMFGKSVRDTLMSGQLLKMSKVAAEQAARGLRNTEEQVEFGRQVDKMYGQYGKFSPGKRHLLQMYTPFATWAINAAKFVAWTLPKDHPVLTAMLASAYDATEDWRKGEGLGLWLGKDGGLPKFLQGSVNTPIGRLRLSRYTPFGAFTDPAGTLGGMVLPQVRAALSALSEGEDWKGKDLTTLTGNDNPADKSANSLDQILWAGWTMVNSSIPAVAGPARIAKIISDPDPLVVSGLKIKASKKASSNSGAGTLGGGLQGSGLSGGGLAPGGLVK